MQLRLVVCILLASKEAYADNRVGSYTLRVGSHFTPTRDRVVLPSCNSDLSKVMDQPPIEIIYSGKTAIINSQVWKVISTETDYVMVRREVSTKSSSTIWFVPSGKTTARGNLFVYGINKAGEYVCADAWKLSGSYRP